MVNNKSRLVLSDELRKGEKGSPQAQTWRSCSVAQVKEVKETNPKAEPSNWDLNDPKVQEFLDIRPGPGYRS